MSDLIQGSIAVNNGDVYFSGSDAAIAGIAPKSLTTVQIAALTPANGSAIVYNTDNGLYYGWNGLLSTYEVMGDPPASTITFDDFGGATNSPVPITAGNTQQLTAVCDLAGWAGKNAAASGATATWGLGSPEDVNVNGVMTMRMPASGFDSRMDTIRGATGNPRVAEMFSLNLAANDYIDIYFGFYIPAANFPLADGYMASFLLTSNEPTAISPSTSGTTLYTPTPNSVQLNLYADSGNILAKILSTNASALGTATQLTGFPAASELVNAKFRITSAGVVVSVQSATLGTQSATILIADLNATVKYCPMISLFSFASISTDVLLSIDYYSAKCYLAGRMSFL